MNRGMLLECDCKVPNYEMIGHTVSDAGGAAEQRELVC